MSGNGPGESLIRIMLFLFVTARTFRAVVIEAVHLWLRSNEDYNRQLFIIMLHHAGASHISGSCDRKSAFYGFIEKDH